MRAIFLASLFLLAACNGARTGDEADAEGVETGTGNVIELDMIGFPDMEANGMLGASCAFAEGNSVAQLALVKQDVGFLKIDGTVLEFTPDTAGAKGPTGYWVGYQGQDYSFTLALEEDGQELHGGSKSQNNGVLEVRDSNGELVYRAQGYAQCSV